MDEDKKNNEYLKLNEAPLKHAAKDRCDQQEIHNVIEEAIQQSEERFRVIAEMLPVVIYETDEQGIVQYVNSVGYKVSGYTEEDFNNGVHAVQMLAESDREKVGIVFREVLQGKSYGMREFTAQKKNGETFPVISRSAPIYCDGQIVGIRGVVVDISELKITQEALAASEEKFQAQYKAIPVPTFTLQHQDGKFVLIDYNDAAMEITNGMVAKYAGKMTNEFQLVSDSLEVSKNIERCFLQKENITSEVSYKFRTTGMVKNMVINYVYIPPDYVMLHAVDVTESRRAEKFLQNAHDELERRVSERTAALENSNKELLLQIHEKEIVQNALRKSEKSYKALFESAPDGIILVDQFFIIVDCNQTICSMLDYQKNELIGKDMNDLFADLALNAETFKEQINSGGFVEAEAEAIRKDGTTLPLWGKSTLIYNENEEIENVLIYCRDYSTRKAMQKDLSNKAHEVELYNDILTHDLNNINQTTLNYVNLLISGDYGEVNEDQQSFLLTCRSQIDRCTSLIEKIKTLSQLHLKETKDFSKVNLGHIISRMIQNVRAAYNTVNMTVDYSPGKSIMVRANHLIHQMIYNLLENAIKHSRGDDAFIKIYIEEIKVNSIPCYRINFEDLGPGIRDEVKPKIFNRFESSRNHKGSGLGLAIVKTLANYFEGSVEVKDRVEGEYSQGSRFIVTLPKA